MAITLADLARNSGDKLVQGFVNELITDSVILDGLPFDNCLTAEGTSDLVYSYKRVKQGMTAAFRALGEEPQETDMTFERITTNVGILSASFNLDRVAKDAAVDLYNQKLAELKNAILRAFNKQVVGGDKVSQTNGFDGLAKTLKGTATEFTSAVDMNTIDKASAMKFATEMDTMLSALMRTPDVLIMNSAMKVKLNAICREIGIAAVAPTTAGATVTAWNGIPVAELKDGALPTNEIYALCYGLDGFHGITLKGDKAVTVNLPDWNQPGAVKKVDAEFVCGCALKAVHAAGVLKPKAK